MTDPDFSAKHVVIIGAKPGAALPDIPASYVLTANAAVTIALEYRKKYNSRVVALASSSDLLARPDMQEALSESLPDEIVLLGEFIVDADSYVKNHLRLNTVVTVISFPELYLLLRKTLGWRIVLFLPTQIFSRGLRSLLTTVIPDIWGDRTYAWMARSTGLNAIMYALRRFPNAEEIIAAGIGLQAGGHFQGAGMFAAKTAKVDRLTMRFWPWQLRKKVYTTEKLMSDIGRVPLWSGKVFYLNASE